MLVLTLLFACQPTWDEGRGPLGIPTAADGVTWAGAAAVDLSPVIAETYTDLNGDFTFQGCLDDPTCGEPFDDADGDGWFDATFIGGFGPMRPANGVHDPVWARAVVLARDGEYLALVGLDLVGLGSPRIHAARDALAFAGFDPARLIVASTHNHQGPDTMGLWGNPYNLSDPVSGIDEAYQERVTAAIEQAVRDAAADMRPVTLRVGATRLRDRDPYFTGERFGGKNPEPRMHGMIYDGRDPVVVSDQLLVMQGRTEAGDVVFTWTNWSGHPEVRGSNNDQISSDWPGVTRDVLEAHFGGVAVHMPESLGGMQSALSGQLPLVQDDGTHVWATCDEAAVADATDVQCYGKAVGDVRIDDDGDPVPEWAPQDTWEFVTSHGWHIAEAAIDAIEAGEDIEPTPIRVAAADIYVPIENVAYQMLAPSGIFDLGLEDAVTDPVLCPEVGVSADGCIETRTFRVELGTAVGFVAVPGEVLPEVSWGLPEDDPLWQAESADPGARGEGSVYFPQHDADCDTIDYAACTEATGIGDCDCLKVHAWPYLGGVSADVPPLLEPLGTEYRAILGMADNYLSYVIPEPDFNKAVSLLSPDDGDHYEDTVSPAHNFATRVQEGQAAIAEQWE